MVSIFSSLPMLAESSASVLTYFAVSNFAGQVIVVILIVFSIVAWAVMLGKYNDLLDLKNKNAAIENILARNATALGSIKDAQNMRGPYAAILREAVAAWHRFGSSQLSAELLTLRMQLVENAIQRALSRQYIRYESKMVLLGSVITGAPFLGLLGTTWGVMDSFGSMGEHAALTLQALAPGVSGALLTTVAGLVVAIPSVFGYNFLLTLSKGMVIDMENFASSLADKIELEGRQKILATTASAAQAQSMREELASSQQFTAPRSSVETGGIGRVDFSDDEDAPSAPAAQTPPQESKFKISFDDDEGDDRYQD